MLDVVFLKGLRDYGEVWALQRAIHEEVVESLRPSTVLLLEHNRTFTMGRRGGWANLLTPSGELLEEGVALWQIDRGGDITYHGPGQLVVYPIVRLERARTDLAAFLCALEQSQISLLAEYGVEAHPLDGFPGVWCGDEKISALGVRLTRGVTLHGIALNVETDLRDFGHIQACGLVGKGVTSMACRCASVPPLAEVARGLMARFSQALGVPWREVHEEELPTIERESLRAMEAAHRLME